MTRIPKRRPRLPRFHWGCPLLSCVGCWFFVPEFSTADYDNGISFSGTDDVIHAVLWKCPEGKAIPCPIVVYLKNGKQLGERELSSQEFMHNLGAETRNEFGNQKEMIVEKSGYSISCTYEKEKLVSASVNLYSTPTTSLEVTVDGKDVTLPIPETELFQRIGQPHAFHKSKPPQSL